MTTTQQADVWISTATAAEIAGVSRRSINHWARAKLVADRREPRSDPHTGAPRRAQRYVLRADVEREARRVRSQRFPAGFWPERLTVPDEQKPETAPADALPWGLAGGDTVDVDGLFGAPPRQPVENAPQTDGSPEGADTPAPTPTADSGDSRAAGSPSAGKATREQRDAEIRRVVRALVSEARAAVSEICAAHDDWADQPAGLVRDLVAADVRRMEADRDRRAGQARRLTRLEDFAATVRGALEALDPSHS